MAQQQKMLLANDVGYNSDGDSNINESDGEESLYDDNGDTNKSDGKEALNNKASLLFQTPAKAKPDTKAPFATEVKLNMNDAKAAPICWRGHPMVCLRQPFIFHESELSNHFGSLCNKQVG
jgi:hypothetical protein